MYISLKPSIYFVGSQVNLGVVWSRGGSNHYFGCNLYSHIKLSMDSCWMGDHIKSSKVSSWMGDQIKRRIPLNILNNLTIILKHMHQLETPTYVVGSWSTWGHLGYSKSGQGLCRFNDTRFQFLLFHRSPPLHCMKFKQVQWEAHIPFSGITELM